VELSTGLSATSLQWNETRQRINNKIPGAKVNNERLLRIRKEIQDIFNLFRSTNEEFDGCSIKNKLLNVQESKGILAPFDFYLESILAKLNKGYSMETYKHYKSSKKRLADFINSKLKRTDISVQLIDYKFLDAFDIFTKNGFNIVQNTIVEMALKKLSSSRCMELVSNPVIFPCHGLSTGNN
jgi:hypothetical protein